jgi:hypothetical protein
MDIESLLKPAGKSHIWTEALDKEIYQAVIDSIVGRENITAETMSTRVYPSSLVQLGVTFARQYLSTIGRH